MRTHGIEYDPDTVPGMVAGTAVYAGAAVGALVLAVVSFVVRASVVGGLAFLVLAGGGIVATRLVARGQGAQVLDPVATWAVASLLSAWGWGLLLTGDTHWTWLFGGGMLLGGALIGTLRLYTSRHL